MRPTILSLFAILSLCPAAAGNDEFLLRVDTIGYLDSKEVHPKEILLHSIEALTRANEPFHSKIKVGSETLVMSGRMDQHDGEFRVQLRYSHSVNTGAIIGSEPVSNRSRVQTTVCIAAGKSVVIGESSATSEETTDKAEISRVKSNNRYVLFLSKYQPAAE